jgi:hypothetical protein
MAENEIPVSIDYTSRAYYALKEELIARIQARIPEWTASESADFGLALVEAFAYMGDIANYYIDRIANESFITTATQRDSILSIAETYGYAPSGYTNSLVTVKFFNESESVVVIPAETRVSGEVVFADTVETVTFTTSSDCSIGPAANGARGESTVLAYQGELNTVEANSIYGVQLGSSDGEPNQKFEITDFPVVTNSIEVYVQGGTAWKKWTRVQHLLDYGPNDAVYTTRLDQDNNTYILFGDGISGAIPTFQSIIRAKYVVGGGTLGNIAVGVLDTIAKVPGLSQQQTNALAGYIDVTNTTAGLGGSNPESNDSIRQNAPLYLRAQNRAITLDDFENLALSVENCGKANAIANSPTSVTLYIAPYRGFEDFEPTPGVVEETGVATVEWDALKSAVNTYLSDKMLIGTTLTITRPTYVPVTVNIEFTLNGEFTQSETEKAIKTKMVENFSYNYVDFGAELTVQDVEYVLQRVSGVKSVKCKFLFKTGGTPSLSAIAALPNEILTFAEPNIVLELGS